MIASLLWLRGRLALHNWRRRFPQAVIHAGAEISNDSTLGAYAVLFPGASLQNAHLGDFCYAQARTQINNARVGAFCSIASDVVIGLAAHPVMMVSTSPVFYDPKQPLPKFLTNQSWHDDNLPHTDIGADVWIGQRALIRSGITVGTGSVIGAGAVVTRDVAPYSIVGGVPARLIRKRFEDDICRRLLESRWWELERTKLVTLAPHFRDPISMLRVLKENS